MNTVTIPIKDLEHMQLQIDDLVHKVDLLLTRSELETESRAPKSGGHESKITISEFGVEFLTNARGNYTDKTQCVFRTAFKELARILGDIPLGQISEREIARFLTIKKQEASDWTARKHYTALASGFEAAKKWGYVTRNPWREVKKPIAREAQAVHLTRMEFDKVLASIPDRHLRAVCICAVLTGARQAELLSLRWSDVDLDNNVIHIRNSEVLTTKNKRNRLIPINESLHKMLCLAKQVSSCVFVFHRKGKPLNPDPVSRGFKRAIRRAGLNDKLHFHSLRHTFATWLVESNVSIYEVQRILGHSNLSTTQVYSHLVPERLHGAVNKIVVNFGDQAIPHRTDNE